jgi:hypothetical protein
MSRDVGCDEFRDSQFGEDAIIGKGLKPAEESMQSSILFSRIHP